MSEKHLFSTRKKPQSIIILTLLFYFSVIVKSVSILDVRSGGWVLGRFVTKGV